MREALKLALEHIEGNYTVSDEDAIAAIKEALAQPEQEPVAFICQGNAYMADDVDEYCTATHIPLYTTTPQRTWVELTDEEILRELERVDPYAKRLPTGLKIFAHYLEAKLKEKNGYAEEKNT